MQGKVNHMQCIIPGKNQYDSNDLLRTISVSVIIPTYNRSRALVRAIESVLSQTEQNIEILVCDDGSTDNTKEEVLEISKKDSRVRYLNCGHGGRPAIPRNIGIKNAHGEWLAFLDDDDIWYPSKLECQLLLLKEFNQLACCTNAYIIDNETNTKKCYFDQSKDKVFSYKDLVRVNPIINSSMMIHRSLISSCIGFPEAKDLKAIEDYALWHRICGYTNILYLDQPLVGYTVNNSTSIRLEKKVKFSEQKRIIMCDFQEWLKKQPNEVKYYFKKETTKGNIIYFYQKAMRLFGKK